MKKYSGRMRESLRYTCLASVVAFGFMTIIATGGGGSGDGGTSEPTEQNAITSSTAPKVASAIGQMTAGVEAALFAVTLDVGSGAYCPKTLLKHADDLIQYKGAISSEPDISRRLLATLSETEACSEEGSITTVITWDGPALPTNCSELIDPAIDFIFTDCQEVSESMNGTVGISYTGDLCIESPAEFSMYFTDFTYLNQDDNSDLTLDLIMDFSEIQYDGYDYILEMYLSMDGTVYGTFDNDSIQLEYDNWIMTFSDISYDISNEIVGINVTFGGSFSGAIDGNSFDESYEDLVMTFQHTTVGSVSGTSLTVDGSYSGGCLDGWVIFETIEPMFIPDSSDSPTSGQIRLSGNGEATIIFQSDGSITIDVEGEESSYENYDHLSPCI